MVNIAKDMQSIYFASDIYQGIVLLVKHSTCTYIEMMKFDLYCNKLTVIKNSLVHGSFLWKAISGHFLVLKDNESD